MADNPNRDQEAARMARENERKHQDAIDSMARKNEDVQREAQKARQASEQRKIEMSRQNEY